MLAGENGTVNGGEIEPTRRAAVEMSSSRAGTHCSRTSCRTPSGSARTRGLRAEILDAPEHVRFRCGSLSSESTGLDDRQLRRFRL